MDIAKNGMTGTEAILLAVPYVIVALEEKIIVRSIEDYAEIARRGEVRIDK